MIRVSQKLMPVNEILMISFRKFSIYQHPELNSIKLTTSHTTYLPVLHGTTQNYYQTQYLYCGNEVFLSRA